MDTSKLTQREIALIQALVFYHPEGLTTEFDNLCQKMMEKLNLNPAVGKFKVWK